MINVKRSKFTSLKTSTPSISASLGAASKQKKSDAYESTSASDLKQQFTSQSAMNTSMPSTTISSNPIIIDTDPMLMGLITEKSQGLGEPNKILYKLYRDIYYNDSICGSAVDIMSNSSFGEFTLGGCDDNRVLNDYMDTCHRLGVQELLPEMSKDQLVLGKHCSSLLYNANQKKLTDLMPYAPENLTIVTLPFYNQDPIITVNFPNDVLNFLQSKSKRIEQLKKSLGEAVFEKIKKSQLELEPLSTVYVPRKTFSNTDDGISYFRRVLPIYLIEKNLYRGTLVESARRQRGILHLTLGTDEWIPNVSDMEFMTELFMNADSDPLGAIIATRQGIETNEIRQGGDFWKSTDFADSVQNAKLRCLGISEAFLSGDVNISVSDNSMTMLLEMLYNHRQDITQKFFYNKLFPLISLINGYTLTAKKKLTVRENLMREMDSAERIMALADGSKLFIPKVIWTKQLKQEGDQAYLDRLNSLSEKGIPIPLRLLAAAGGLSLDDLLKQSNEDLDTRKQIKKYTDEIAKLNPQPAEEEGMARTLSSNSRSAVDVYPTKPAKLNRDFESEVYDVTKTGKRKLLVNQKQAQEKVNKKLAKKLEQAVARVQNKRK